MSLVLHKSKIIWLRAFVDWSAHQKWNPKLIYLLWIFVFFSFSAQISPTSYLSHDRYHTVVPYWEGWGKHALPQDIWSRPFKLLLIQHHRAAEQLEESAIYNLPRTWAFQMPIMASVAVIARGVKVCHSSCSQNTAKFVLIWSCDLSMMEQISLFSTLFGSPNWCLYLWKTRGLNPVSHFIPAISGMKPD